VAENARYLEGAGHLRPGVTAQVAAELMWAVTAPETIELLVHRRGWSLENYADLVYQILANALLSAETL
jgi:hypothetical protein